MGRVERAVSQPAPSRGIRISDFGLLSDFRFRASGFHSGFTLIELILAIGVMALVLIAMNAVFFSALQLRARTNDAVDASLPAQQALGQLRRDLQGAAPPNGMLSGSFKVGSVSSLGLSLPVDIEFCTTTGPLRDNEPWGEVQQVTYALRLPGDRSLPGKDLIRSVTRNLLSVTTPQPEEQWMMGGVENLELLCYDGSQWRDYWDTTVTDTNLPSAVRVRIQLAGDRGGGPGSTMEIVVPIDVQSRTNLTSTTSGGG
jgi:type II secretion system protein J